MSAHMDNQWQRLAALVEKLALHLEVHGNAWGNMCMGNCMKLLGLLIRKPTKIHTLTMPSTPDIRPAISSQPDSTISEFSARIVPSFAAKFLL